MRRRSLGALGALVLAGAHPALRAAAAGEAAPDVALPDCRIASRLSELRGRWVYLDFWASWCAPCRLSFPWMNELQATYRTQGLLVLAISVDTRRQDAEDFLARIPAKFALAFDPAGEAARRFAIKSMPSSAFVDPQGVVRFTHRGFRLDDRAALQARVGAALRGAG